MAAATSRVKDDLIFEWATPLFVVDFADTERLNSNLATLILRKEAEFTKRARPIKHTPQNWSRFSSFHYRQDIFSWKSAAISTLRTMIVEAAGRFAARYFTNGPLAVTQISGWANVNRMGDWNGPHNHFHFSGTQCLSGVYWVAGGHAPSDMFDLDGALIYFDPRGYYCPAKYELVFGATPGRMVLQPPWLGHCVTPKRSVGERISIAFDIFTDSNPWWKFRGKIV